MASYSRRSRSAGSQGSTCGSMMVGASASAAEHVVLPDRRRLMAALAGARMASTPANTRARLASSVSKAPAAARLSITRLLMARGLTRAAKSASEVNRPSLRASTITSTACAADALQRRQRVEDGAVADLEVAPERLTLGASTLMPSRCASARNSESLSVLPMSSVIDAARNSTG